MVLSTLGFAFSFYNPDEQVNEQNTDINEDYSINIGGNKVYLTNSRTQIGNVSTNLSIEVQQYSNKPLYLDVNGSNSVLQEIGSSLGKYASRTQEACYGKCEENLPEKDCSTNLIVWKDSLENKVYQEDNCVFIEGDINSADAFLYKILK